MYELVSNHNQFVARELMSRSQIIFAPYNYVISPEIRKAMSINLTGTSILFDEAHNILNTATDAAGLVIDYTDFINESNMFLSFLYSTVMFLKSCSEAVSSSVVVCTSLDL